MSDEFLNVGFFIVHTSWVAFNCAGWIWRRTRPWHLATSVLTVASWVGLGMSYGWGYCPCTDWHWQLRARMGFRDPPSYIQLLVEELTGLAVTTRWADVLTVTVFSFTTLISVLLNGRDWRHRAGAVRDPPLR